MAIDLRGRSSVSFYDTFSAFPSTGSTTTLYVDRGDMVVYIWNGSSYEQLNNGSNITTVANYSELLAIGASNVPNMFYWCSSAQGTSWLPGPLGGTYYNSGLYYSNGTSWEYMNSPYQATQLEVDAGIVADKFVTPSTFYNSSKWDSISSGGIFGISNSSGVYTYYSTLTLAMAAATSGQTIEMFANVTETGAVTITLKNGVNINGNGYTYTLSNSGTSNALIDNAVAVSCEIFNIKTVRTLGATPSNTTNLCLSITSTSSEIKCNGVFFKNTNGTCVLNQGNLWGISAISTNGNLGTIFNTGNLYNSCFESTNSLAINAFSGNVINCQGISQTSNIGISSGTTANIYNSHGKSLSGNGISGSGKFYKTIAISTSGNAIEAAASSEFHQCIGISTSGLGISGNSYFAYQCRFISSSNYGAGSGANAEHYDCLHESTSSVAIFGYIGLKLYRGSAFSKWNNAGGHAFSQWASGSGSVLNNVFLRVTNASANCIHAGGVTTFNYSQNAFLGATTSVNANITQGITNLEDAQGNQKL